MRADHRQRDALRPVTIVRSYTKFAEGSVLVAFGDTKVLCTATLEDRAPAFLRNSGSGWLTAEYSMLPRSSAERIARDNHVQGRGKEISRLIGRSLRCIVDLEALGERQVIVDCDVLQADGGTRTAAITGAYVALYDALDVWIAQGVLRKSPLLGQCAAVSVGLVGGQALLDLAYEEDFRADVDMNIVMRDDGSIIEVQATAEGKPFPRSSLDELLDLGKQGIEVLFERQKKALACA